MITKNISVIQGQNPDGTFSVAKLDANGYILTANAVTVSGEPLIVATDNDPIYDSSSQPYRYVNAVIGPDADFDQMKSVGTISAVQGSASQIGGQNKLLVEQGKQFATYEVYVVDTQSLNTEGDYSSWINANIGNWVGSYGLRYDDMLLTTTNNGAGKTFLILTILRYF